MGKAEWSNGRMVAEAASRPLCSDRGQAEWYAAAAGGAAAGGRVLKDSLVLRIRAFVRSGTEEANLWTQYSDIHLQGAREPARHDVNVLNEFCLHHGVPEIGLPQGELAAPPPAKASAGLGARMAPQPAPKLAQSVLRFAQPAPRLVAPRRVV